MLYVVQETKQGEASRAISVHANVDAARDRVQSLAQLALKEDDTHLKQVGDFEWSVWRDKPMLWLLGAWNDTEELVNFRIDCVEWK